MEGMRAAARETTLCAVMIVLQIASRTSVTVLISSASPPMRTATPRSANSLANGPKEGERRTMGPRQREPSTRLSST
jgi:hypothetical protein